MTSSIFEVLLYEPLECRHVSTSFPGLPTRLQLARNPQPFWLRWPRKAMRLAASWIEVEGREAEELEAVFGAALVGVVHTETRGNTPF